MKLFAQASMLISLFRETCHRCTVWTWNNIHICSCVSHTFYVSNCANFLLNGSNCRNFDCTYTGVKFWSSNLGVQNLKVSLGHKCASCLSMVADWKNWPLARVFCTEYAFVWDEHHISADSMICRCLNWYVTITF